LSIAPIDSTKCKILQTQTLPYLLSFFLFRSELLASFSIRETTAPRKISLKGLLLQGEKKNILSPGNTKGEKDHCTIELLFDWFGLVCFANKNKNCPLSYSRFQTSQTGGQWYSDTSPFSFPCFL